MDGFVKPRYFPTLSASCRCRRTLQTTAAVCGQRSLGSAAPFSSGLPAEPTTSNVGVFRAGSSGSGLVQGSSTKCQSSRIYHGLFRCSEALRLSWHGQKGTWCLEGFSSSSHHGAESHADSAMPLFGNTVFSTVRVLHPR
jgi:hypothetical protein